MVKNVAYKKKQRNYSEVHNNSWSNKKENLSNVYLSEGYKATKEESLHQRHD